MGDSKTLTADKVIGQYLKPKRSLPVYEPSLQNIIGSVNPGQIYGPVYSWLERDGQVYWMFDISIPGQTPGAWYIKHEKDAFELVNEGGSDLLGYGGLLDEVTITPKSQILKFIKLYGVIAGLIVLLVVTNKKRK
jgi:hypothetical protein